jgi:hypothetical protein
MNDVAVGQDQTVGCKDEPGAVPLALPLVVAAAFDGDDGRTDELHCLNDSLGIGVEKTDILNVKGVHTGRTR